jgi:hypothetical protein
VGERYKCSDANCGCEIEVTNPGRTQQETSGDSSMNAGSFNERSRNNQPTGASGTGETGVGALRNAESAGISTPGDFGSQGATGEGVFGLRRKSALYIFRPLGFNFGQLLEVRLAKFTCLTSKQDQVENQTSTAPVDSLCTKLKQAAAP